MSVPSTSEYQSREAMLLRTALPRFVAWLELAGVLVQEPTSEYEVLRYRCAVPAPTEPPPEIEGKKAKPPKPKSTPSVIYRRKDGSVSWTGDALTHWNWFVAGRAMTEQPEIVLPKKQRSWTERRRTDIIERDGTDCYFCGKTMVGHDHTGRAILDKRTGEPRNDMTIEHLLGQHFARTEGLEVNHMENLVLAHAKCNRDIGHRPMSEKMTYREIMHDQTSTMWSHPEIETPRQRTRK